MKADSDKLEEGPEARVRDVAGISGSGAPMVSDPASAGAPPPRSWEGNYA